MCIYMHPHCTYLSTHNAQVSKKEVDDHKPDNETVPHCVLMAKWMKKKQEIKPLVCKVNIQGTIKDDAFFTIDIDPGTSIKYGIMG